MSKPTAYVHLVYERVGHGDLLREAAEKNPEGRGIGHSDLPPEAAPAEIAAGSIRAVVGGNINSLELLVFEGKRLWVEVTPPFAARDWSARERVAFVNEAVDTLARHFFCKLGRPLPMPEEEPEEPEEEES